VPADIIAVAGLALTTGADTICAPEVTAPLAADPIDTPTLAITFSVNDSSLAGREGTKVTSRMIGERLFREAEGNVAIHVNESTEKDAFEGRRPRRIAARRVDRDDAARRLRAVDLAPAGAVQEPIRRRDGGSSRSKRFVVDVDEGVRRHRRRQDEPPTGGNAGDAPSGGGKLRLSFIGPTRGLIGYQGEFLADTRGHRGDEPPGQRLRPHKGGVEGRRNGVLVSTAGGFAIAYALWNLEERGPMFIEPGAEIYEGMIIGAHTRGNDLDVNPAKGKQLTNIRTTAKDEAVRLTPPQVMSLEQAIAYIADDELVEVTPKSIRLRKLASRSERPQARQPCRRGG